MTIQTDATIAGLLADTLSEYSAIKGNPALRNVFQALSNATSAYANSFEEDPVKTGAATVAGLMALAALGPTVSAGVAVETLAAWMVGTGFVSSAVAESIGTALVGYLIEQGGESLYNGILSVQDSIITALGGATSNSSDLAGSTLTSDSNLNFTIVSPDEAGLTGANPITVQLPTFGQPNNTIAVITSGDPNTTPTPLNRQDVTGSTITVQLPSGTVDTATVLYQTQSGYIVTNVRSISGGVNANFPDGIFVPADQVTSITPPAANPSTNVSILVSQTSPSTGGGFIQTNTAINASGGVNITSAQQLIFDNNNNLIGSTTTNSDGSVELQRIDPSTGQAVLTTNIDNKGNFVQQTAGLVQQPTETAAQAQANYNQFVQAVADTLATQVITKVLIKNNLPASIATQAFADAVIKSAITSTTANFTTDFASSVFDITGGIVGSDVGDAIAQAIGVPNEIGTLAGGVTGNLLAQSLVQSAAEELKIVQPSSASILSPENFAAGLAGAAGSFVGSQLASLVEPTNTAGAITGAIASAATIVASTTTAGGSVALAAEITELAPALFTNPVGIALGIFALALGSDFLGTVIGDLFGGLFGGQPSVGPNATAQDEYNPSTNTFGLTSSSSDNGGDVTVAQNLVKAEAADENMILQAIGGKLVGTVPADSLGYFKGKYFYAPGIQAPLDFPNTFTDAEATVDFGTLATLRSVQFQGGNLFMAYMLHKSNATTLQGMLSDLTAARDYSLYASNPAAFDLSLALSGDATQYTTWQTELARIQALGLDGVSVLGMTTNLYGTGGVDFFTRTAGGQLAIAEFNNMGLQVAGGPVTFAGGAPVGVDSTTTIMGFGQNLFGTTGRDIFLRRDDGQVVLLALNGQNQWVAGGNVAVIGTATGFYNAGGNDIFYQTSSGQLAIVEFDSLGQQIASALVTFVGGAPVGIDSTTTIVGLGQNLFGPGGRDIFVQLASGQMTILELDSQNRWVAGGNVTVLGSSINLFGSGGNDVFYQTADGHLAIVEFSADRKQVAGGFITFVGGAPVQVAAAETVVGIGQNLFGTGGRDIYLQRPDGQVVIVELDNQNRWVAGNNVIVLGTATNLYGAGGNDVFYQTSSGQLAIVEFNSLGQQIAGGLVTFVGGAAVGVDSTATIVGIAQNIFNTGGHDVILRRADGQGVILELNASSQWIAGGNVTLNTDGSWTYADSNAVGGDVINAGSGNGVIVSGNGQFGNSDLINVSNGKVTVLDNARADIYGGANTITIGQNDLLGVQNGDNNAIAAGIGSDIYVNSGNGDIITATNGGVTIYAAASVSLGLVGGNNGVVAADGDTVNVSGNGQFGDSDYITISNGTVNVAASARADIYGGGNTVTTGLNDLIGVQNGNNNALTVGSGSDIYVNSGTGDVITAANGGVTIFAAGLVSFSLVDGGNTVFAADGDTVNVSGNGQFGNSDYLNIANGTVNVAANARADVYGGGDYVTAGANTLIGIQNGNNNTVTLGSSSQVYVNSGTGDTINGGGNDQYFIAPAFGQDTINNGTGTATNGSVIFGSGITDEKLWFKQSGNDLIVQQLGTTDQVDIAGWFTGAGKQVQAFDAGGLQLDTQVALLVQAMASYATGHTGFNPTTATTMPTDTTLQNAIVAAWHS